MATTTIVAEIEDVRAKVPHRGAKGTVGVVYTPKEWIGKMVYLVLKRPVEVAPSTDSIEPPAPSKVHIRHLRKKRLRSRHLIGDARPWSS